tara:strand:+ start:28351 stop:28560 length:210 start_codon:yes stop_codon:yes gene_type:complete
MADITMCSGEGCNLKLKCYRHTANRDEYQYFFAKPPIENGKCDMFWGNKAEQDYTDLKDVFLNNIIRGK